MKILIVNGILIGDENATGVTMKNMLYGINNINYMQYCIDINKSSHCEMVDTEYLNINDVFIDKLLNLKRKNKNFELAKSTEDNKVNYSKYHELFKGFKDCCFCRLSKSTINAIMQFKPDAIYTMGGNIRVLNQAYKISKKVNVPVIFHCMDNWRTVFYTKSNLVKPLNNWLNYRLKSINKRSVINLAICEKMAKVYERDYNVPYSHASNCVFDFNEEGYTPKENSSMLVIFSGGLHFGRANTLHNIAKQIEDLNNKGYKIKLEVFAPKNQVSAFIQLFDFQYTKLLTYVEKEKQMENIKRADILLHVESDDPTEIKYMNLSFSTKLVEYFAAARTVVGYGPKEMASLSYIMDNDCGMVAENYSDLKDILIELYNKVEKRKMFAKNAHTVAKNNHSQKIIQERVFRVFEKTVKDWRINNSEK